MRLARGRVDGRPAPDHGEREATPGQAACERLLRGVVEAPDARARRIFPLRELREATPGCGDRLVAEELRRMGFTAEWYGGERVWIRPSEVRVAHVVARQVVEVDVAAERERRARGRPAYAPMPERLAPPEDDGLPELDRRSSALVLATSPRVRRCLGEVVALGHAPDLAAAAHAVLAAYALDLEDRLRLERGDAPAAPDERVAAHLRLARAQPGWAGAPSQGYAPMAPSAAVAAFWQEPGYLWRGRPKDAPYGLPGAFRRVEVRGASLLTFDAVERAERATFLPVEWADWEWCPADGAGRLVGW